MKRLGAVMLVGVLGVVLLCLGATQELVNQSGATEASDASTVGGDRCFSWHLELPSGRLNKGWEQGSWESDNQGGTLDVVEDPTGSGRGYVYRAAIPGDGKRGPELERSQARALYVYRVYGFINLGYHPAPCTTSVDVWASKEFVETAGQSQPGTVLLDVYDVYEETGHNCWMSANGYCVGNSLQAKLWDFFTMDGQAHLDLRCGSCGNPWGSGIGVWEPGWEIGSWEPGAPSFTPEVWHTVAIQVNADRTAELFLDGVLVSRNRLWAGVRGGTIGGHPGPYIKDLIQHGEYSVRGTLLVDNYKIECGDCQQNP